MRSSTLIPGTVAKYLREQGPGLRVVEVQLARHGGHQPAADVLGEASELVGKAGDVVLAHVGEQCVGLETSGRCRRRLVGGGDSGAIDGLVQVHADVERR